MISKKNILKSSDGQLEVRLNGSSEVLISSPKKHRISINLIDFNNRKESPPGSVYKINVYRKSIGMPQLVSGPIYVNSEGQLVFDKRIKFTKIGEGKYKARMPLK